MSKVFLGLGSNLGDKEKNLLDAIKEINNLEDTEVVSCSNIYETDPIGYLEQDDFLNMVIEIETKIEPSILLANLLKIEVFLNRERKIKWGPRTVDIDILIYDEIELDIGKLTLPHPRMFKRAFVLKPLMDIYKNDMLMGRNILRCFKKCIDTQGISLYKKTNDLFKLRYKLKTNAIGRDLLYFDEIDSTNTFAKSIASVDIKDGMLIIADEQKKGRGRLGRVWDSKKGEGIWMSILLRPTYKKEYMQLITLVSAIAVVEGIKKSTGIQTKIKWPNDIILAGRKVCGILCESSIGKEGFEYVIVGIGINVNQEIFAEELLEKAISLKMYAGEEFDRGDITKAILECFEEMYHNIENLGKRYIIKRYKERAITIGSRVKILSHKKEYMGLAVDINKKGNLIVLNDEGILKEVHSGEVSVRGIQGYT